MFAFMVAHSMKVSSVPLSKIAALKKKSRFPSPRQRAMRETALFRLLHTPAGLANAPFHPAKQGELTGAPLTKINLWLLCDVSRSRRQSSPLEYSSRAAPNVYECAAAPSEFRALMADATVRADNSCTQRPPTLCANIFKNGTRFVGSRVPAVRVVPYS